MILGERFFKLSNALFSYQLTPIQFTVYSFLVSSHRYTGAERVHSSGQTIPGSAQRQRPTDQQRLLHPGAAPAPRLLGTDPRTRRRGDL